jgi:subtilase family serine protease
MSLSKVIRHIAPAVGFLAAVPLIGLLPAATANAASHAPATTGAATSVQIQAAPQVPVNDTSEGAVSPTATITGAVVLKPRNNAALTSFIASVTDKNSPSFHQYLPNGSFDARFGPTSATISAVTSTLEGDGLSVTNVASDGLLVSFSGSARNVESAFHTGLNTYKLANGSMGQATTSAVDVPSAISSAVSSVVGLNDLVQEQATGIVRAPAASAGSHPSAKTTHFAHPAGSPTPCAVATTDAQGFGGLTDDQIANAYGAFGLYGAGDFGAGQSIAVYELEPFSQSDLSTFDTCYFGATEAGQMASRLTVNPVDGGQPPGQGSGESILDVDDVSALAPGANIDVYEAPNNTFGSLDEYSTIVNRDVDKIVTTSWGECEQDLQTAEPGFQQSENYIFEQAAAQGQSVFAAAGDTGDDSCNEFRPPAPAPGQNPLSVLDPASQPYVVGVGGTTIDDATQPPAEHEWNDGANWGAGGGGISQSWTMPSWQQDATVPGIVGPSSADYTQANKVEAAFGYKTGFCQGTVAGATAATSCRLLPDVSAQADEFTGAITIFSTEFGGPYDGWITIGGTSSATPIWAALLALVNASPTCTANPTTADGVGFVSPLLYEVASNPTTYAASFNDITSGNNDIYGLDNGLVFPTTPGYDLASGLGSPEVTGPGGTAGLAANLCGEAAAPSRPTVSGLSPVFVPTSGGSVLVTGTGFGTGSGDVAGITVGAAQIPVSAITVNSPTQLTASFPAAATALAPGSPQDGSGPANVVVTTDSGASSGLSSAAVMQYVDEKSGSPVPSVTGVSPYGGTQAGGTPGDPVRIRLHRHALGHLRRRRRNRGQRALTVSSSRSPHPSTPRRPAHRA